KLDKAKDKYLDFELIHQAAQPVVKKWKKPKGLICMECIEKDPKLKNLVDAILKAGNPTFSPEITCRSAAICQNYEPSSKPNVNCRHIAVIGDTVYCKRSHPGSVKLMVERAERVRLERQSTMRLIRRAFKNLPEPARSGAEAMLNEAISGSWQPPSQVVRAAPVNEVKPEGDSSEKVSVKAQ
ncbi:unnamed protein product, partial [marine sediment metagenome]